VDRQGEWEPVTGDEDDRPDAEAAGHLDKPAVTNAAAVMPAADVDPKAAARRAFIDETATALGRRWAEGRRAELLREGRPAAGGWPGTLREARGCVEREFPRELQGHRMPAITTKEREIAARATYASARSEWRRRAEPEEPFLDGEASGPKRRAPSEP
jgi:hypothetical protein